MRFKLIFSFLIVLAFTGLIIYFHKSPKISNPESSPVPSSKPKGSRINQSTLEFKTDTYQVAWTAADAKNISLIANFVEQSSSREFLQKNDCPVLINGGFYTTESEPTGQFIENGQELNSFTQNNLLNSVIAVDRNYNFTILKTEATNALFAVQTGPLLINNGSTEEISLQSDKYARRMVAATSNSSPVFISFYKKDSTYQGPLLEDLPALVLQFSRENNLNISSATNLDGGSASVLISDDFRLSELMPVGSFFCIK